MNNQNLTGGARTAPHASLVPPQVTLHDIAREAGTSISTVSRVLNGKQGAGEATRLRVLEVVDRMKYTVNYAASNLKKRTMNFVGIFEEHGKLAGYYAKHIEEGYTACANALSTFNAHFSTRHVKLEDEHLFRLLCDLYEDQADAIDGLLLVPFQSERIAGVLNRFADAGVSIVFADKNLPDVRRVTCVKPDNETAGRIAAETMFRFLRREGTVLVSNPDLRSVDPYGKPGHLGVGSFTRQMETYTNGIRVEATREPYQRKRLYREVRDRLESDKQIVGIFAASARHTAAIAPALRDSGRDHEVQMIGSEVYAESFSMLRSGVIDALIYKNPFRVGYKALDNLFGFVVRGVTPPPEITIMPRVVLSTYFARDDQGYATLLED